MNEKNIVLEININLTLWEAIKLRIAGKKIQDIIRKTIIDVYLESKSSSKESGIFEYKTFKSKRDLEGRH